MGSDCIVSDFLLISIRSSAPLGWSENYLWPWKHHFLAVVCWAKPTVSTVCEVQGWPFYSGTSGFPPCVHTRIVGLGTSPCTWWLLPHSDLKGMSKTRYEISQEPWVSGGWCYMSCLHPLLPAAEQCCGWHLLGRTHLTHLWVQISAKGASSALCLLSCILSSSLAPLTFLLLGEWRCYCFSCLERCFPASYLSLEKEKAVGLGKYHSLLRSSKIKFWGSSLLFFPAGVPDEWDLLVISTSNKDILICSKWTTWGNHMTGWLHGVPCFLCLKSVSSHKDLPFGLLILRALLRCSQCIELPPSTLCIIR